ncbi:hypothetical protein Nepgr_024041 [Nepenthes gracilis]|uniref:Uncharacterized protein n=1 Tax=Nepenthes gracilis TaxID=150966 RepID=A0AAD3XYE8_NEPGR|nr:hypothetical protein Nepgr_024041 [Nepenthes gracilis]
MANAMCTFPPAVLRRDNLILLSANLLEFAGDGLVLHCWSSRSRCGAGLYCLWFQLCVNGCHLYGPAVMPLYSRVRKKERLQNRFEILSEMAALTGMLRHAAILDRFVCQPICRGASADMESS